MDNGVKLELYIPSIILKDVIGIIKKMKKRTIRTGRYSLYSFFLSLHDKNEFRCPPFNVLRNTSFHKTFILLYRPADNTCAVKNNQIIRFLSILTLHCIQYSKKRIIILLEIRLNSKDFYTLLFC